MIFSIVSIAIYLLSFAALVYLMRRQKAGTNQNSGDALGVVQQELAEKTRILTDLARISLGLVEKNECEALERDLAEIDDAIRAEKGRLTITEAELEAVDTRLRELEELKRELEVSNMDAIKELEMLRSQEREMKVQNDALRQQLESSVEQLETLLEILASSAAAVARLTSAKNELVETEKKCSYYEEQIGQINSKYMMLKKAYDALDIEYAQLYEKQQSAEAAGHADA